VQTLAGQRINTDEGHLQVYSLLRGWGDVNPKNPGSYWRGLRAFEKLNADISAQEAFLEFGPQLLDKSEQILATFTEPPNFWKMG
jgi:hypothetical protein